MTVQRDVVINVKTFPDKDNLANLSSIAKQVADLQKTMNSVTSVAMKEVTTATSQAAAAAEKAAIAAVKQAEAVLTAARAAEALAKAEEQVRAANDQVVEASARTMQGVMSTARGFMALGLAGEENLEKLARGLVKLQGFMDITKGIIDVVVGIQKWSRAYEALGKATTAANQAATASALALAEAQNLQAASAGRVATASGAAATAVGGLAAANGAAAATSGAAGAAGGIAAMFGTGSALVGGVGAVITALSGLALAAAAIVGALGVVVAIFDSDFREGLLEWIGWTNKAADATKSYTDAMNERAAKDKSQADWLAKESAKRKVERDYTAATTPTTAAGLIGQLRGDQAASSAAMDNDGSLSAYAVRREANERELATLERIKQYHADQLAQAREYNVERVRGAQRTLGLLKEQYDKEKSRLDLVKSQREGAAVSFGSMTAGEQAQVLAAKKKLDAKGAGSLRKDEWDTLGKLGLKSVEDARKAEMVRKAQGNAEYVSAFDQGMQQQESAAASNMQQIKGRIDAGINVGGSVTVKLDSDPGKIADELMKTLGPQLKAVLPDFEQMIRDVTLRMIDDKYLEEQFKLASSKRGAGA